MSALIGLQCHLCKSDVSGRSHSTSAIDASGPLEPVYDYASIQLTREDIERRPKNLWRYRELLPIVGEPRTGFHSGFTPLVRCTRLAERLGVSELYIKDDSVNHPTLSYKDRVVSVAATRAVELGLKVLACASTGNLANSVAAHAARLGIECCVFIPDNLEAGKLLGSAIFGPTILADRRQLRRCEPAVHAGGGSVRLGLREHQPALVLRGGSEDLRLRDRRAARLALPAARRVAGRRRHAAAAHRPRASASCARSGSSKASCRAYTPRRRPAARRSFARSRQALDHPEPVRPDTIAKSIAIGNPADGYQVLQTVRATGGSGTAVSDAQIVDAIRLLAETEGIFTEPAGGTTLAGTIDLIDRGVIGPDESVVVCVTGNGYKTAEVVSGKLAEPVRLSRPFKEFEAWWEGRQALA